jgi:RsiW-degrading membrane proteinase PrsW (M82 family)
MVLKEFCRVVTTDRQELRPKPCDFPWELVIYLAIIGLLFFLWLLWRSFQSIRSRLYARREKELAVELAGLIEEKCKLLEILSLLQKEHDGLASSLKDAG